MENAAAGAGKEVGKLILGDACNKFKEYLRYLRKYKENVDEVQLRRRELEAKGQDVHRKVEIGLQRNREETGQAKQWQEAAEASVEKGWEELLKDEEARRKAEKCCFGFPWNPKYRLHLSKLAAEKSEEINHLLVQMEHCTEESLTVARPPPSLADMHTDFYEGLESRMEILQKIMTMLKDDKINVIGIHGMGGAGKTTLVEEVSRRADKNKMFTEVLFPEVTQQPDIKEIQRQLAKRIGFPFDDSSPNKETALSLSRRLKEIKEKGKLLVILDNIWKKFDLHEVGIPFDDSDLGCKIVLTSREEGVCKTMGATHDNILRVGMLDPPEVEKLFRKQVGGIVDCEDYKGVLEKVLKHCPSLPLSIKILADTLRNQSVARWERVARQLEDHNITSEVKGQLKKVMQISFDFIDDEGKKLYFLLCCLFPPGFSISIDTLLKYGMGLGLFEDKDSLPEALKQAYDWADELRSSSLLLEFDSDLGVPKIHDEVREVGKSFETGNHFFHVGPIPGLAKEEFCRKYTGFSGMRDKDYELLLDMNLPRLQLLLLQKKYRSYGHRVRWDVQHPSPSIIAQLGKGMENLKVLDLSNSNIETLPASIVQLGNLQTLLLEYCSLRDISHIGNLVKLEVLSLKGSINITCLPKDTGKLVKLRLLDLTFCRALQAIPVGVLGNLTRLEGLYMRGSFCGWEIDGIMACLSELRLLNLHVLEIDIKSIKQLCDNDFSVSVSDKLLNFSIGFGGAVGTMSHFDPFRCELLVFDADATHIMKKGWKTLLSKTEHLCLERVEGLTNVVACLSENGSSHFPKLEKLLLKSLPNLKAICHGTLSVLYLFPSLQDVQLNDLDSLYPYALPIQVAAKLKILCVFRCKKLKYIFSGPITMGCLENVFCRLQMLMLYDLPELEGLWSEANSEDDQTCQALFKREMVFSSLEILGIRGLHKIEELWEMTSPEEFTPSSPMLRELNLEGMPKLRHVWRKGFHGGSLGFQNLKHLRIHFCGSLENVCSPSIACDLKVLEGLTISGCDGLKQVISTEDTGENEGNLNDSGKSISFAKLWSLSLQDLPSLRCLYKGSIKMEFLALAHLSLYDIPNMEMFTKSTAEEDGNQEKNVLFDRKMVFSSLGFLTINGLGKIEELWEMTSPEEFTPSFPKLRNLYLEKMPKLRHVWRKGFHGGSLGFQNLKRLTIEYCGSLENVCPLSIASRLKELESLQISHCDGLKQVISSKDIGEDEGNLNDSGKSISFAKLLSLSLQDLPSLRCLYKGSIKLEFLALADLWLCDIPNMEMFTKSTAEEDGNQEKNVLFDRKGEFPSLKKLKIKNVPKFEKEYLIGEEDYATGTSDSQIRRILTPVPPGSQI